MTATQTLPKSADTGRPSDPTNAGLPHLAGPAAEARQVLAAHFLRCCDHIVEIGGHLKPITGYLMHRPRSVLSVDPKTPPFEAETLNGAPCKVRHIARKFQDVDFDYEPFSYGFVLLGLSLRPYGQKPAVDARLKWLVDNASVVVIDHPVAYERSKAQLPDLIDRPSLKLFCAIDLGLHDDFIADSPYARRRFAVYHPVG